MRGDAHHAGIGDIWVLQEDCFKLRRRYYIFANENECDTCVFVCAYLGNPCEYVAPLVSTDFDYSIMHEYLVFDELFLSVNDVVVALFVNYSDIACLEPPIRRD